MRQLRPGTQQRRRQKTPEEQLRDEDEVRFVASEAKEVDKEDGTWGAKERNQKWLLLL
jgi:hypothetical protein